VGPKRWHFDAFLEPFLNKKLWYLYIFYNFVFVLRSMGTIASVLQWRCGDCGLINPTEKSICYSCSSSRAVFDVSSSGFVDNKMSEETGPVELASKTTSLTRSISQSHKNSLSKSNSNQKINSNSSHHSPLKHSVSNSSSSSGIQHNL
jgi:hypothetical protein